ncbi:MAG: ATP-binding protein [Acidimicrobiales bacterium]
MADNAVTLSFPASSERVRLARTLVATLGDDLGFDLDEVEDVRIAVDELCFVLLDLCSAGGRIELVGRSDGDQLVVEGSCGVADEAGVDVGALPELTSQILATVVDDYEVGVDGSAAQFRFAKSKS